MSTKQLILLLIPSLFPFFSWAQQTLNYTITVDSIQRNFILYVPASYSGQEEVPLVFSFHGLAGTAQRHMDQEDFRPVADTAGFIVAYPNGAPVYGPGIRSWNLGDSMLPNDVAFTSAMIDTISNDFNVNLDRVYACGMSYGGFFSIYLAGQLSDKIASVASVAGTMQVAGNNVVAPSRPFSYLHIHGTNDFNVAYNGNQALQSVDAVLDFFVSHNNCDTVPTITQLPDVNSSDGSTVEYIVYGNGDNDMTVEHFKIIGGGHTWPGENTNAQAVNRDINGCVEIWKFFSRYDLNGRIEQPLGIKDKNRVSNITIYPNPFENEVNLKGLKGNETMTLFNSIGNTLYLGNDISNIDLTKLPVGVYFLKVEQESKHQVFKLLKN